MTRNARISATLTRYWQNLSADERRRRAANISAGRRKQLALAVQRPANTLDDEIVDHDRAVLLDQMADRALSDLDVDRLLHAADGAAIRSDDEADEGANDAHASRTQERTPHEG